MGAISSASSLPVLKKYLNDANRSVRETCEIALAKIEWDHSEEGQRHHASTSTEPQSVLISLLFPHFLVELSLFRTYTSVDPAPPTSGLLAGKVGTATESSVEELRSNLLDTQLPLFERYRAMFALRNIGSPMAVDALAAGFSDDSALFKYVFPCLSSSTDGD
jgi:deoxyhypusine monooxygenase